MLNNRLTISLIFCFFFVFFKWYIYNLQSKGLVSKSPSKMEKDGKCPNFFFVFFGLNACFFYNFVIEFTGKMLGPKYYYGWIWIIWCNGTTFFTAAWYYFEVCQREWTSRTLVTGFVYCCLIWLLILFTCCFFCKYRIFSTFLTYFFLFFLFSLHDSVTYSFGPVLYAYPFNLSSIKIATFLKFGYDGS